MLGKSTHLAVIPQKSTQNAAICHYRHTRKTSPWRCGRLLQTNKDRVGRLLEPCMFSVLVWKRRSFNLRSCPRLSRTNCWLQTFSQGDRGVRETFILPLIIAIHDIEYDRSSYNYATNETSALEWRGAVDVETESERCNVLAWVQSRCIAKQQESSLILLLRSRVGGSMDDQRNDEKFSLLRSRSFPFKIRNIHI